ncbi:MAG: hypothetical protein PWQ51_134 [Methanolobus sp.]|jgi:hypothetical protein|uniref:Uncharacterized protein n=2 Tax=Methanosarcinaceae TaxID=2206 RepID=W9DR15_METTI|nr:hypothetical protein MettiDRAFT_1356 [Methanolobus tindarius DSM 2278]MDK2832020.1 hypothetical protein [Methanolobus sp.]MDK2937970.1 hypothetical protein [Methanolobus sp.]
MNIAAFIGSSMLFALFAIVVLFVLINMSSRLALIILLIIPLAFILVIPDISIAFLSIQQMSLANGLVPVNNFHILLMIWSTLIGVILYTEFLTWYLGKGMRMKKNSDGSMKAGVSSTLDKGLYDFVGKVRGILNRKK